VKGVNDQSWSSISETTVCVIPVYNEARVLATVLDSVLELFPNVMCIDDGSSDSSDAIARKRGVRVVRHAMNVGQGGALQTAFSILYRENRFKYVLTFDADGQHSAIDAQRLVQELDSSSVDVVFATRFDGKHEHLVPLSKRVILRSVVWFNRVITDVDLSDTHNGLRAIRLSALPSLQITHFGMAHATELVSRVLQADLRYSEVPVRIEYSNYSRSKGQSVLNSLNILLDYLWR